MVTRRSGSEGQTGSQGLVVHTAIFKIDNQQGPTIQYREFCSIFCNNLKEKRICKECIYINITESLCHTPETNTTQLINYTPTQKVLKHSLMTMPSKHVQRTTMYQKPLRDFQGKCPHRQLQRSIGLLQERETLIHHSIIMSVKEIPMHY